MNRRRIGWILILSVTMTMGAYARTAIQNKGSDTLVNVAQAWAKRQDKAGLPGTKMLKTFMVS